MGINELEFSSKRKRSSVIVKDLDNHKYYIYSKGSVETFKKLIHTGLDLKNLELNDNIIIKNYPELRVLSCGYKKLENFVEKTIYDEDYLFSLEQELEYLRIIGLRDSLQDNIKETVEFLESKGKYISVCTGDRKATALAITKECGITKNEEIDNLIIASVT